jgi:CheY-like chemotaxis protein
VETRGHTVTEANTGRTGVQAFEQHAVDLVLTDIVMPDMDGVQAIALMRQISTTVGIIAISGGGRARNLTPLQIARQFGANRILEKPFKRADVLKTIDDVLAETGEDLAG